MLLYVHRDHKDFWGRGAQDGHLDFHTVPELRGQFRFTSTRDSLLGTIQSTQDGHLDFHTVSELRGQFRSMLLYVHSDRTVY